MSKLDAKLMLIGEKTIELGELYIKLAKTEDEEKATFLTGKIIMISAEIQRLSNEK